MNLGGAPSFFAIVTISLPVFEATRLAGSSGHSIDSISAPVQSVSQDELKRDCVVLRYPLTDHKVPRHWIDLFADS